MARLINFLGKIAVGDKDLLEEYNDHVQQKESVVTMFVFLVFNIIFSDDEFTGREEDRTQLVQQVLCPPMTEAEVYITCQPMTDGCSCISTNHSPGLLCVGQ